MFGVPPNTLPLVTYIGIFCYWVLVHYNMSFKTIAGGFNGAFRWYGPLPVERENFKQIYQNYLMALKEKCGPGLSWFNRKSKQFHRRSHIPGNYFP